MTLRERVAREIADHIAVDRAPIDVALVTADAILELPEIKEALGINHTLRQSPTLIVGQVLPEYYVSNRNGWLLCDGSEVSRNAYPQLFAVVGTSCGKGDGSTTFNLPPISAQPALIYAGKTLADTPPKDA